MVMAVRSRVSYNITLQGVGFLNQLQIPGHFPSALKQKLA